MRIYNSNRIFHVEGYYLIVNKILPSLLITYRIDYSCITNRNSGKSQIAVFSFLCSKYQNTVYMQKALLTLFLSCSFGLFGQQFDTLSIRVAIEHQMATYPKSTLQDIYKSFYQDRFGPGHMITDTASARSYLMRELSEMTNTSAVYYEPTGNEGRYVRVYLSAVADSLITTEQLLDAFVRSANADKGTDVDWEAEWNCIVDVITKHGIILNGFDKDVTMLNEASRNRQAVHHSRAYNEAYHPHYRIVERSIFENELQPLLVK